MSEKIKYAPRKVPGLFAAIVLLVLAAGAYGVYLIAPTVSAMANPTSGKANTGVSVQAEGKVTVSDLKVARVSAKTAAKAEKKSGPDPDTYGQITEGATTAAREGVHVVWNADTQCGSDDDPTYKLEVSHTQLSSDEAEADYATRTFTTTGKSLYLGHIQNGLTYDFKLSGACNNGGKYGDAVTTQFTQQLPTSNGVTVRSHSGKYSLFFGRVSTSPDVRYEFQYSDASGQWLPFKDASADIGFTRGPAGFSLGYNTQFRVRAYTLDQSAVSPWSVGRSAKGSTSYSGYNSYGGYNSGY